MARWIVDEIVPVDSLVPEAYMELASVRSRLYDVRGDAPFAGPPCSQNSGANRTSGRTLRPRCACCASSRRCRACRNLGQVIARNQHLHPALRKALAKLENGIRDVQPEDMRAIIHKELGREDPKSFAVEVSPNISRKPASVR